MSSPQPEPPGDQGAAGGFTAAEATELRQGFRELQQAVQELREARSEPDRKNARRQVQEAEADLDTLARQLGISRDALERATGEARRAERKEELRPIIQELLAEERAAGGGEGGDEGKDGKGGDGKGGDGSPDPDGRRTERRPRRQSPPPPLDTPPADTPHWSERPVTGFFRP